MPRCFAAAVDVGTSRVKLVAYGEDFSVTGFASERSPLRLSGEAAVQDAAQLAEIFRSFVRRASEWGCSAVGVSVYRGSMVAWDAGGRPISDVITWLDRRSLRVYEELPAAAKLASHLPVLGAIFRPGSPALAARMLLSSPEVRRAVDSGGFLWSLDSFLAYTLTGRFVADVSQATLTGLISPYTLKPLGLAIRLLGLAGLRFPELIGHGEPVAQLDSVSVGPFIADQQAAAVGLGCLDSSCLKVTMGTGVFIDKPVSRKPPLLLRNGLIPVVLASVDGSILYGVEGFASGVGLVFEAVAELFGGFERLEEEARSGSAAPALVVPVPAGLRTPYRPRLQGAVLGISPGTGPSSLAGGLVAGTALLVRHMYGMVARAAGRPSRVRLGGGLSRLRVLVEWVAEALGEPVERSLDPNDSARGAALLAAHAAGLISRRELYNPPVGLERVEPRGTGVDPEVEEAWRKLIDVLGSASFSRRLARILEWSSRSRPSRR